MPKIWPRAAVAVVASVAAAATAPSIASTSGGFHAASYVAGSHALLSSKGPRIDLFRTGFANAGEPNIGIAHDGTIYSDVQAKVVRSANGGRSWTDITPSTHVTSLDPFLYVDPSTSRVYKSDLAGTCQILSWSDDRGATWTTAPAACNQSDHQTLSAAPPVAGLPTVGYPNILYNCSQTAGYNGYSFASGCARSLDGGLTWHPTGTYAFSDPSPYGAAAGSGDSGIPGVCNGDVGPIFAGPDGTLYVPRGWCGQPWLAISHDGGTTWTRVQVAHNGMNTSVSGGFGLVAPGSGQSDHEAAVMADGKGHVFYLWMALDRLPYLAVSRDGGRTFGAPQRVSPPSVREAWGPALDFDAKGRLAIAYMGSTNSPGKPWTGSYAVTTFTGYLGLVAHPLDRRPVVVSGPVTPPDTALARGRCGPGRCNDGILDFIDVALGPAGDVWGAFVDTAGQVTNELVIGHLRAR
ncbi:MAG: exo-alpha-sialidase [Frankiales bacterium]|nr:exo-alpha-sialidase [Frankiales bacterium]